LRHKQALNYLLGQLERHGYLQRQNDPRDQRFKRITVTDRGQRAARAMRDIVREVETEWEQELGPERFAELHRLLTDLNDHLTADTTHADQAPTPPPT
jgi:DNA-binding MarR family transcriptional regulator